MKATKSGWIFLVQALVLAFAGAAVIAAVAAQDKPARKDMVLTGDAKCTRCHDEGDDYPVLAIGKTRHGTVADGRTPSCTSCHGDSPTHIEKPANATERPKPDRTFTKKSTTPIVERNEA